MIVVLADDHRSRKDDDVVGALAALQCGESDIANDHQEPRLDVVAPEREVVQFAPFSIWVTSYFSWSNGNYLCKVFYVGGKLDQHV